MSLISVDLPLPETPVIAMKQPSGNSTVTSFRLCSRAPWTISCFPLPRRRPVGDSMRTAPERYWPVSDAGFF